MGWCAARIHLAGVMGEIKLLHDLHHTGPEACAIAEG
jgi:hypothetical protein